MQTLGDYLYFGTRGQHDAEKALIDHSIVMIKGRQGTGKSTIALHLALSYHEKGYKPYIFEQIDSATVEVLNKKITQNQQLFIIFENVVSDELQIRPELKEWKSLLLCLFRNKNMIKIIITTYFVNQELQDFFLQNVEKAHYVVVDLNEFHCLSRENKIEMLKGYCDKYERSLNESDFNNIINCDPVIGFPLMCKLFCSDDCNFARDKRFFISPPILLVEKFENLKCNGIDNMLEAITYAALVYIALKGKHVSFYNDSIDMEFVHTIFKNVFQKEYANDVSTIRNAALKFNGQYLASTNVDELQFSHRGIRQALLITYGQVAPAHLLKHASLDDLLDIVRPKLYRRSSNESVVQISTCDRCYYEFSQRIAIQSTVPNDLANKIGSYFKDYGIGCNDVEFMEIIFERLSKSAERRLEYLKQNSTDLANHIPFLIDVFYEMTSGCTLTLPIRLEPVDFRLTWELIAAAKNAKDDTLRELFIKYKTENAGEENMHTVIDAFGNTLLHYIIVWGYADSLSLLNDNIVKNQKPNYQNFTPLWFAAYMGRSGYFSRLLRTSDRQLLKYPDQKDRTHFDNLNMMKENGLKLCEKKVSLDDQEMKIDKGIVTSISFGNSEQFKKITSSLKEFFRC